LKEESKADEFKQLKRTKRGKKWNPVKREAFWRHLQSQIDKEGKNLNLCE